MSERGSASRRSAARFTSAHTRYSVLFHLLPKPESCSHVSYTQKFPVVYRIKGLRCFRWLFLEKRSSPLRPPPPHRFDMSTSVCSGEAVASVRSRAAAAQRTRGDSPSGSGQAGVGPLPPHLLRLARCRCHQVPTDLGHVPPGCAPSR